jgi:para-nitrobenzyl esterase
VSAPPESGRAAHATSAHGRLAGQWENGVAAFKGIPFAAPPVGDLRWRPPKPPDRWDGERAAVEFGPAPLQPQPPRNSVMFHTNFADRRQLRISEDCLYLNVWTPEPSAGAGLPVMVWVHGGGNRYGHGSQDIHNGGSLSLRGIVVVTLNYRLGALGFLAHPGLAAEDDLDATGNYGLQDVVAVLEWVQHNISVFGGDPGRVTLAGNSAGAAHVNHLMAAQSTRSLFRAAIGQSSAGIYRAEGRLSSPADARAQGIRYATEFGADGVQSLRRISGVEFVVKGHFGPVIDGRVLTRDSQQAFDSGEQHAVPLLVGSNLDEGVIYSPRAAAGDLVERAASAGAEFAELYPCADDASARASARLFIGESRFVYPIWRWARTHRATAVAPTWLYRFEHAPPFPSGIDLATPPDGDPGYGVYHTAELPYTGDNLSMLPWPWQDVDRRLAKSMADTWARFVERLDPNGPGIPQWEQFDAGGDGAVLVVGDTVGVGRVRRLDAMHLLDQLPRPI